MATVYLQKSVKVVAKLDHSKNLTVGFPLIDKLLTDHPVFRHGRRVLQFLSKIPPFINRSHPIERTCPDYLAAGINVLLTMAYVVNCFQIFVSLTSKTTYCLLVTHSQLVISCFRIKKSRLIEAGFFFITTIFVFQKSTNCCTG